jgi:sugar lactone lactonase YvrE
MSGYKVAAAAVFAVTLTFTAANAWNRGNVQVLTVLPDLLNQSGQRTGVKSSVEGLTVGPDNNIYVTTFGFNTQGETSGPANLIVIAPNGSIVRQVPITCSSCGLPVGQPLSPHFLGLRFNPATGRLWVLDFGDGLVLDVDTTNGTSTLLAGPVGGSGLNALTFDAAGNGYVSDSFNATIWLIPKSGGSISSFVSDALLGNGGGSLTPPFGANGIEFNKAGSMLFVANTAFHQIIQIPWNAPTTPGGLPTHGTPSIFVTGINAPDGIAIDNNNNIWICANQEDEIVVVDNTGKVIAKLGDFDGIDPKGIARGLLFPASLAFSNDRQWLYVSNLTLNLPFATMGGPIAIDSAWTLQVQGYTVSKLQARIPPIAGD